MAKKRKHRVPNLDNRDSLKGVEGANLYERVVFELEDNAEEMFRLAVENLSPGAIAEKEKRLKEDQAKAASGNENSLRQVDLHGLTLGQAQHRVKHAIDEKLSATGGEFTLRIVTGKGIHSGPGGGILAREIHEFVRLRFSDVIISMTDSPASVTLSGVPMRGYFDVKFRGKGRRS